MRIAALLLLPLVAGCDHGGSSCGSREAVIAELPDVKGDDEACEEPPRCEDDAFIVTCVDGAFERVACEDVCRDLGFVGAEDCAENEDGVDACVCDEGHYCG